MVSDKEIFEWLDKNFEFDTRQNGYICYDLNNETLLRKGIRQAVEEKIELFNKEVVASAARLSDKYHETFKKLAGA